MRKSYIDPPYPNIPDEFLAAFTCGLYDGDGCTVIFEPSSPNPHYFFCGSEKFIRSLHERLQREVGVKFRPIRQHSQSRTLWLFNVCDVRQTVPLTRYLHDNYYGETGVPYFLRKHEPFKRFLTPGYFTINWGDMVWF